MPYANLSSGRMTREQSAEVIRALANRGVTRPCPRCGNAHFTLLEGFFNQPVSGDLTAPSGVLAYAQGPTVPSVVTACTNCGFVSQHALGVLGLFPDPTNGSGLSG